MKTLYAQTKCILTISCLLCTSQLFANPMQQDNSRSVVLITIDGLRWQEVFTGADQNLIESPKFNANIKKSKEEFWNDDPQLRRQQLMPNLWRRFNQQGQVYGNRNYQCHVDVSNQHRFSYPGYNELLVGYSDDQRINSNDWNPNPNITILEQLNQQTEYHNKVAVSAEWEVISYIVNEERSNIEVRTPMESPYRYPINTLRALGDGFSFLGSMLINNEIIGPETFLSKRAWQHVAFRFMDGVTFYNAMEQTKQIKPKILYLAFGGPDENAHRGKYDTYLMSIQQVDSMIEKLWQYFESLPEYQGKTTFIISPDHGRGLGDDWTDHGTTEESKEVWFAILGPSVTNIGEIQRPCQHSLAQVANTLVDALDKKPNTQKAAKPYPFRAIEPSANQPAKPDVQTKVESALLLK